MPPTNEEDVHAARAAVTAAWTATDDESRATREYVRRFMPRLAAALDRLTTAGATA